MIIPKIKPILVLFFMIAYGAGCSNSLDTGETEPFSTMISYQLSEETHVKLWIENSYRTTVATLVDEVKQAGFHQVRFGGTDSDGNNLPEGVYTYHLETDQYSQSRVMHIFYR